MIFSEKLAELRSPTNRVTNHVRALTSGDMGVTREAWHIAQLRSELLWLLRLIDEEIWPTSVPAPQTPTDIAQWEQLGLITTVDTELL